MAASNVPVTARVAEFVASWPEYDIPAKVKDNAKLAIRDSIGTTLAACRDETTLCVRAGLLPFAGPGRSRGIGVNALIDPASAALQNATAGRALDYDSIGYASSGCIGSIILWTLAALADNESRTVSGKEVLAAYCIGWEAASAIARGVNVGYGQYDVGWHTSSTTGVFAAALAAARLLSLPAELVRSVISVAASEASGLKGTTASRGGQMITAWHSGKAARNGVVAAQLVRNGFRAHPSALETPQGYLQLFAGPGGYDSQSIVGSLGQIWDLAEPGPILKVYPCCGLIHSGLDATLGLLHDEEIEVRNISSVRVLVHEFAARVMRVNIPRYGYEAKFSIPYCIGSALAFGAVGLNPFDTVSSEAVEFGKLVTVEVHPDQRDGSSFLTDEFTIVEIIMRDGRSFLRRVNRMDNRGTGPVYNESAIRTKFDDCIRYSRMPLDADRIWDGIGNLDENDEWLLPIPQEWGMANEKMRA